MDDAFCYWRWAEYSISASIMTIALAITLGIREQNTLACLFMLTWCCMVFGFLVEYISCPKALVDTVNHKYPIGPLQMQKFADSRNADYGKTDYYEDPSALKLISQTEWDVRSPHTLTHLHYTLGHKSDACPCIGAVGPPLVRRGQPKPAGVRSARGFFCAVSAHAKLHSSHGATHFWLVPDDCRVVRSHRSAADCEARPERGHRSHNSTMGQCRHPWHRVDLHELLLCMSALLNTPQRHQTHPRATPWLGRCRSSSSVAFRLKPEPRIPCARACRVCFTLYVLHVRRPGAWLLLGFCAAS